MPKDEYVDDEFDKSRDDSHAKQVTVAGGEDEILDEIDEGMHLLHMYWLLRIIIIVVSFRHVYLCTLPQLKEIFEHSLLVVQMRLVFLRVMYARFLFFIYHYFEAYVRHRTTR